MEKHRQPSYREGGKKTGTERETRILRFRDGQREMGGWRQKKGMKAGRAQETPAGREVPVGLGGPRDQGVSGETGACWHEAVRAPGSWGGSLGVRMRATRLARGAVSEGGWV